MTAAPGLRSSGEMHAHLVEQVNSVLRRPGMYGEGGELALWILFENLFHLEGQNSVAQFARLRRQWNDRGAFSPTGIRTAFERLIPGDLVSAVVSLYVEVARVRGWLIPDRMLPADEYGSMRAGIAEWVGVNRTHGDILDAFGPPSIWIGSKQARIGNTFGYVSEQSHDPMIFFHLWDGSAPGRGGRPQFDEALVLAVRCGDGPFPDAFTFTPLGEHHRSIRTIKVA